MLNLQELHATDLRTYMECKRRFYYGNVLRIKPKPSEYQKPDYFDFGTRGHSWLAQHYRGGDALAEIASLEDNQAHHKLLHDLYIKEYAKQDAGMQIASVENTFFVDFFVKRPIRIYFTLDLLYLEDAKPKPYYAIMDHKFYKSFPDERELDYDFQATFYLWAARRMNINAKKFTLNVIKKSAPVYPTPLKNGELSKSQATLANTEYDMYLWSIEQLGLNPIDYAAELDFLKKRGSALFKRYTTRRTDEELNNFEADLRDMLRELHRPSNRFIPIPSRNCPSCPYSFLCKAQSTGSDVNNIIKYMFDPKEENER